MSKEIPESHVPSVWILISRLWRILKRAWQSPRPGKGRFRAGLLLLVTNQPFGWGMMVLCAALAARFPEHRGLWLFMGAVSYGISWGMLGLGVVLAGIEAKKTLFTQVRVLWKGWMRMRRMWRKS